MGSKILNLKTETLVKPNKFLFVVDVSGSMTYNLPKVREELLEIILDLPDDSMVSLAYFSSENGQNGFILLNERKKSFTRKKLEETLDSLQSLGMTCYGEVLSTIANSGMSLGEDTIMVFFTDGMRVVSNPQKDDAMTREACKKLKCQSIWVGVGDYVNTEFLNELAMLSSGVQVSVDSITEALNEISLFVKQKKSVFKVETDSFGAEIINNKPCLIPNKGGFVYPSNQEFILVDDKDISENLPLEVWALVQTGNKNLACERLIKNSKLGLARHLRNTLTHKQAVEVTEKIVRNELEDKTPVCDLSLLDCLAQLKGKLKLDKIAYKRIGRKSVSVNGLKFIPDDDEVEFSGLVFNKDRMNVSISFSNKGTVDISKAEGVENFEGDLNQKVSVFRTYTIIQDGVLNIKSLTFNTKDFVCNSLTPRKYNGDGTVTVFLDEMPLVSANEIIFDLEKFKALIKQETEHEAGIKYFKNAIRDSKTTEVTNTDTFLESLGIKNGMFSPKTVQEKIQDYYEVELFSVDVNGVDASAKFDLAVEAKKRAKNGVYEIWDKLQENYPPDNSLVDFFAFQAKSLTTDLLRIRSEIAKMKISARVLGIKIVSDEDIIVKETTKRIPF